MSKLSLMVLTPDQSESPRSKLRGIPVIPDLIWNPVYYTLDPRVRGDDRFNSLQAAGNEP